MTSALAYELAHLFGTESRALGYAWPPPNAEQQAEALRLHDVAGDWYAIGDDLASEEAA